MRYTMQQKLIPMLLAALIGITLSCEEEENACETRITINGKSTYFCISTMADSGCSSSSSGTSQVLHEGMSCADIGYTYPSTSGGYYARAGDNSQPGDGGAFTGGSAGAGCGSYNGPTFDIQIDSQCQTAYAYTCSGSQQGVDAACSIYKTYQQSNPNIPDCPYCS